MLEVYFRLCTMGRRTTQIQELAVHAKNDVNKNKTRGGYERKDDVMRWTCQTTTVPPIVTTTYISSPKESQTVKVSDQTMFLMS